MWSITSAQEKNLKQNETPGNATVTGQSVCLHYFQSESFDAKAHINPNPSA